ncbi:riboflavin biosynthesis protein RibF [Buchnera aphidicola (Taiwanaphis decaspermi)]|uniref:riboflavin biosynthesis protein RibF n=1 Tax=Buchnera aphidicola TaxID=9 RepID=UPI0031B84212
MKFINGIHNIKYKNKKKSIITIGNFDGIHIGHQNLLNKACYIKKIDKYELILIIFEPQPMEFFLYDKSPLRLTNLRTKIEILARWHIDKIICIKFNNYFSKIHAEHFIKKILINKLSMKKLIIGDDAHLGYKKQGNFSFIKKLSNKYNFSLIKIEKICKNKNRVSSSLIRKYILKNNFFLANKLLGYSFYIKGKVFYRNKNNKKLGFTTVNIILKKNMLSLKGSYIVLVYFCGKKYFGLANIKNEFIFSNKKLILEAHLINFKKKIYGCLLKVIFKKKIINKKKINSIKEQKKQIILNLNKTKQYFNIK